MFKWLTVPGFVDLTTVRQSGSVTFFFPLIFKNFISGGLCWNEY